MPRFQVGHDYLSNRDGRQYGHWPAGQVVDLSEDEAEWCNRDSPGLLTPEKRTGTAEPTPEPEPEPGDAEEVDTAEPEPEPDDTAEAAEAAPPRKRQPARKRQHQPSHDRTS